MSAQRLPPETEYDPGEIRRFTLADMPAWGEWLIGRISDRYKAKFAAPVWINKIHMMSSDNGFLFIRNDRAVLCVGGAPRVIDGGLVFIEIFAFSRGATYCPEPKLIELPYESPDERGMVLLYRHAREWARSQRAERLFVGQCTDLPPARIRALLGRKVADVGWVSVGL